MSPASRGRRKKNRSTSGPKGRRAPTHSVPAPEAQGAQEARSGYDALTRLANSMPGAAAMRSQARHWWPASHARLLEDAGPLLDATTPPALEDATCELIGRHWQALHEEHERGFSQHDWLEALLEAAAARAADPAVRRLLYGIAVATPPGLAQTAAEILHDTTAADAEPDWSADDPTLTVSPDVQVLGDVYGLRFGLLTDVTGPGAARRTYLQDIDLCHGHPHVLTSGYHPTPAAAVAAWRELVGASAATAEPRPATADLLAEILPTGGMLDSLFAEPLTTGQFTEMFRSERIASEIAEALEAAGRPIVHARDGVEQSDALAAQLTRRFRAWATTARVDLPSPPADDQDDEDDVLAGLLRDWVSPGMTEDTSLACSPHRIAAITAYLNDDWQPRYRTRALALLEPWARFCLEHRGITGQAADHALTWARRAATEPDEVGADVGNLLNLPIDETTLARPPAPALVR